MQGAIVTAIEIGEALSHYSTGMIVKKFNYNTGFYFLAIIAIAGILFFAFMIRETKNIRLTEIDNNTNNETQIKD
jgi:sugar phosphate permease